MLIKGRATPSGSAPPAPRADSGFCKEGEREGGAPRSPCFPASPWMGLVIPGEELI